MRERRAPGRARQAARARATTVASGCRNSAMRSTRSVSAPAMTKTAKPDAERRQHRPAASRSRRSPRCATSATPNAADQPLRRAEQIAALPGEQRPERHARAAAARNSGAEGQVEERRADRDLVAGQRFQRQRIERADEHGRAGRGQEQIVEDQRALARDRREQAALLQQRRAPGKQRERAADEEHAGSRG